MKVIDVNGWRENPNLEEAPDPIKGVIVKISEGTEIDEDFDRHMNNALDQGVPVGVYCFTHARNKLRAEQEAMALVDKLEEYEGADLSLGIWFDMEESNMPDGTPFERAEIAMAFLNVITEYTHDVPVGVYSGYYGLTDDIDVSALPDYVQLWVANYSNTNYWNDEHPERPAKMWQYSDSYKIGNDYYDVEEWYD